MKINESVTVITVKTDPDSFWGNSTDFERTPDEVSAYQEMVDVAIMEEYPNAAIEHEYKAVAREGVEVTINDLSCDNYLESANEIENEISYIIEDVYASGKFWQVAEERRQQRSEAAAILGKKGGSVKSERKTLNCRKNGKKGGRPKNVTTH